VRKNINHDAGFGDGIKTYRKVIVRTAIAGLRARRSPRVSIHCSTATSLSPECLPPEPKIALQEHEIPDIIVGLTLKSVGRIAQ